jgi:hypothetical protein
MQERNPKSEIRNPKKIRNPKGIRNPKEIRGLKFERVLIMPPESTQQPGLTWLVFALLTVATWGVYGVFLHTGQMAMGDPANGRWKAFLFVGAAYFVTAVVAPLGMMLARGATWQMPMKGVTWSLAAGLMGAVGAFGVLLALGSKGSSPAAVMSIVFAGAPIVNAFTALAFHPPAGGLASMRWPFFAGIVLAAVGGCLVTYYKDPRPAASAPPAASVRADAPDVPR